VNAMQVDETPFPAGWLGQGLKGVRPDVGTYGQYPCENLPPLPIDFRGDFEWLRRQPAHDQSIAGGMPAENVKALAALIQDAAKRGATLPPEFVQFFRSPELQQRVRSCTDCYLNLSPACAPSPLADGFLIRFLADSQGCVFWYLYQRPGSAAHCVVASPDFYGAPAEQWSDDPPDPDQIVFCEESFERFLCRFWLENEIWFAEHGYRPPFVEGQRYLESYKRTT
jgi:hypothetical protein